MMCVLGLALLCLCRRFRTESPTDPKSATAETQWYDSPARWLDKLKRCCSSGCPCKTRQPLPDTREVPTGREYDVSQGIASACSPPVFLKAGLSPMTMSSSCISASSAVDCGGQCGYDWGEPSHRRTRGTSLFGGFGGCGDNDAEGYAAAFAGCGNGFNGGPGNGFVQPQTEGGWPTSSSGISPPTGAIPRAMNSPASARGPPYMETALPGGNCLAPVSNGNGIHSPSCGARTIRQASMGSMMACPPPPVLSQRQPQLSVSQAILPQQPTSQQSMIPRPPQLSVSQSPIQHSVCQSPQQHRSPQLSVSQQVQVQRPPQFSVSQPPSLMQRQPQGSMNRGYSVSSMQGVGRGSGLATDTASRSRSNSSMYNSAI